MTNIKRQFGARLRSIRIKKGLTIEDLSDLAGLHSTYVGSVERGERNISLEAIEKLTKGLEMDIYELFLPNIENGGEKLENFLKEIKKLTAILNQNERKFVLNLIEIIITNLQKLK